MINKVEAVELFKTSLTFRDKGQNAANHGKAQTQGKSKTDVIDFNSELRNSIIQKYPNENLITLSEQLVFKQGKSSSSLSNNNISINQTSFAMSQDGKYGIKAVSDNIVNFAIAISGNDTEKLVELKTAIEKGFFQARKAFGSMLPEICYKTHDEIMRKLDAWGNGEKLDI